MVFAHLPAGYIVAYFVKPKSRSKVVQRNFKWQALALMIGSIFPDIDWFPYLWLQKNGSHREFLTHLPMTYVMLALLGYLVGKRSLKKKVFATWWPIWWWFLVGCWLHLITDSILFGVRWLYPLSNSNYALIMNPNFSAHSFGEFLVYYVKSVYFLPELAIIGLALWIFWIKGFLSKN